MRTMFISIGLVLALVAGCQKNNSKSSSMTKEQAIAYKQGHDAAVAEQAAAVAKADVEAKAKSLAEAKANYTAKVKAKADAKTLKAAWVDLDAKIKALSEAEAKADAKSKKVCYTMEDYAKGRVPGQPKTIEDVANGD